MEKGKLRAYSIKNNDGINKGHQNERLHKENEKMKAELEQL